MEAHISPELHLMLIYDSELGLWTSGPNFQEKYWAYIQSFPIFGKLMAQIYMPAHHEIIWDICESHVVKDWLLIKDSHGIGKTTVLFHEDHKYTY